MPQLREPTLSAAPCALDLVDGAHTEQMKHLTHETRRRLADQQTRRLLVRANDAAVAVEIVELARQLVHKVSEAVEHQVSQRRLDRLGGRGQWAKSWK